MNNNNVIKLDAQTIKILANFATLNNSIAIKEGSEIRTINTGRTVMADAIVVDVFPIPFAIYDLRQFLNLLSSLFDKPDIEFFPTHMIISNGTDRTKFFYCNDNLISKAPDKKMVMPSEDIKFDLTQEVFQKMMKATSIFGSSDISIGHDPDNKDNVLITVYSNINDASASSWSSSIPGVYKGKFDARLKTENMKIIPDDYSVTVAIVDSTGKKIGITCFENTKGNLKYFIPTEADSTF